MAKLRHQSLRLGCSVAVLASSLSGLGQTGRLCSIEYADQNQIDYGSKPRVGASGIVADSNSVRISNACVAVFTEKDHRFVVGRMSDAKGNFTLPLLQDGDYRLVVAFDGFGIANMKLKKVPETRADAPLYVHMLPRRIDVTSYIDTKNQTASGLR